MSHKKLIIIAAVTAVGAFILTEPSFTFLNQGYFRKFENIIFAPVFFISLSYFIGGLTLALFSNAIFKLWLQKIVVWFLPLSMILLASSAPGRTGMVSFNRTDYAIALGVLLIVMTLVFALIQKFYYKR